MRIVVLAVLAALLLGGAAARPGPAGAALHVQGNRLVDGAGPVQLRGVYRAGGESECATDGVLMQGPTDDAAVAAIAAWGANAVAVSVNSTCWLGVNGARLGGPAYRTALMGYVRRLRAHGLYVVVTLHNAAPGRMQGTDLLPMPDADHAPAMWRGVARAFRHVDGVLFDLYVEPHGVGWRCWRDGCTVTGRRTDGVAVRSARVRYRAAGMADLVRAVRAGGARQPVLLAGLEWASDLEGWRRFLPRDPAGALVAALDTYDFSPCAAGCRATVADIARTHPVVTTEVGETDCASDYTTDHMRWADAHGVSYLAWTWTAGEGWNCDGGDPRDPSKGGGPSLIADWSGTPTPFGAGVRDHLLARAAG